MTSLPRFLTDFFSLWHHGGCQRPFPFLYYGFLLEFEVLKLKTCSLYHKKLFIQTFSDMINQILNRFFSASDFHTFYDSKKKHFEFSNQDRRSWFLVYVHVKETRQSTNIQANFLFLTNPGKHCWKRVLIIRHEKSSVSFWLLYSLSEKREMAAFLNLGGVR